MLCGFCVWHAVVGAAATAEQCQLTDDHVTSPEVTSWPEITLEKTVSSSPNASAECSTGEDTTTPEMAKIKLADNVALMMFSSLYLLFHVVFVVRICTSVSSRLVLSLLYFPVSLSRDNLFTHCASVTVTKGWEGNRGPGGK